MRMFGFVFFFFSPSAAVTLKIGILEIRLEEHVTVSTYILNIQYLNCVYILSDNFSSLEKRNIFPKIFWSWGTSIFWLKNKMRHWDSLFDFSTRMPISLLKVDFLCLCEREWPSQWIIPCISQHVNKRNKESCHRLKATVCGGQMQKGWTAESPGDVRSGWAGLPPRDTVHSCSPEYRKTIRCVVSVFLVL